MGSRAAASAGYVVAAIALATSILDPSLSVLAVNLSTVALLAFVLRRYDQINPTFGAVVAAAASVGLSAVSIYTISSGGLLFGPVIAGVSGIAGLLAAYADWQSIGAGMLPPRVDAVFRAIDVGAAGILAIFVYVVVLATVAGVVSPGEFGPTLTTVLSTLASGAGTLTVVALYLQWSDRDPSFLDLRMPGLRELGYVVAGTAAILAGNLAIGLAFERAGVDSASHTIIQTAEADPTILLVLVPLSYLVIAPGEELLYRNVVQKSLREWYSPVAGVVVASAIFAAVHLPAYSSQGSTLMATLATLAVVFVLALVLGAVYERTGNVVVSILVHGTFNAIAFAVTYADLTGAFG